MHSTAAKELHARRSLPAARQCKQGRRDRILPGDALDMRQLAVTNALTQGTQVGAMSLAMGLEIPENCEVDRLASRQ